MFLCHLQHVVEHGQRLLPSLTSLVVVAASMLSTHKMAAVAPRLDANSVVGDGPVMASIHVAEPKLSVDQALMCKNLAFEYVMMVKTHVIPVSEPGRASDRAVYDSLITHARCLWVFFDPVTHVPYRSDVHLVKNFMVPGWNIDDIPSVKALQNRKELKTKMDRTVMHLTTDRDNADRMSPAERDTVVRAMMDCYTKFKTMLPPEFKKGLDAADAMWTSSL